jgi:8-oxo-dGTP pyrophosphatase MutT (NUDIX family)
MTAATFVLVTADGMALMEKRRDGHWCYPGGKVEEGETVEQAMAREMREEIGCEPIEWIRLPIVVYGRTDKIGDESYRMVPFVVWQWRGTVPRRSLPEGVPGEFGAHDGVPLEWYSLLSSLAGGRSSCVSPIAAATLHQVSRLNRDAALDAEYREAYWRDPDGLLRFTPPGIAPTCAAEVQAGRIEGTEGTEGAEGALLL